GPRTTADQCGPTSAIAGGRRLRELVLAWPEANASVNAHPSPFVVGPAAVEVGQRGPQVAAERLLGAVFAAPLLLAPTLPTGEQRFDKHLITGACLATHTDERAD